jgi:hypothetical protein
MKTFKQFKKNLEEKGRCWTGYKPVQGKEPFSKGSCVKEDGGAGGAAGGMSVAAVAGSGDSRMPVAQREPGVSKKRNPIMTGMGRRKAPKI